MLLKILILIISVLSINLFIACSNPPEKAIVKRREIVDMKGDGRERFLRMKKSTDESGKEGEENAIEFTKEGKCNFYEKGMLKSEISYAIAPDGKSLLLKDPGGREGMPVKILELNSDQLSITSQMFQNDTVILKAR